MKSNVLLLANWLFLHYSFQIIKRGITPINKLVVKIDIPVRDSHCNPLLQIEKITVSKKVNLDFFIN